MFYRQGGRDGGGEDFDPDWWDEPPRTTPVAARSTRGYPRQRGAPAGERKMPRLEVVPDEKPSVKKPGQWRREEGGEVPEEPEEERRGRPVSGLDRISKL